MSLKYPNKNISVIVIAYNAENTITDIINDIPRDYVDDVIVGDDYSTDGTFELIKEIDDIIIHRNNSNLGMGGNLKIVMDIAFDNNSDVIIQLHGDNQYDATKIPQLLEELINNDIDMVLGSRILGGQYLSGGGPLWKFFGNHFLNFIQNKTYGLKLSDYATGFKVYNAHSLKKIPYDLNRDDFVFDEQINNQFSFFDYEISQVGIPTRYFSDASSVNLVTSIHYGIWTLLILVQFIIAKITNLRPEYLKISN